MDIIGSPVHDFGMGGYLTRVDADLNMARFYTVAVTRNLFGQWTATRQWGRIGTQGCTREEWFDNETAAAEAAADLLTGKLKRGYVWP